MTIIQQPVVALGGAGTFTLEPPTGPSMVREVLNLGEQDGDRVLFPQRAISAALGLCLPAAMRRQLGIRQPESCTSITDFGVRVADALMVKGASAVDIHTAGQTALGYAFMCWRSVLESKTPTPDDDSKGVVQDRVDFSEAPAVST